MAKTFIKALMEFFNAPPFERKMTIPEFQELGEKDKAELSSELNKIDGYEHEPFQPK